jgi:putative transcriptional regulator
MTQQQFADMLGCTQGNIGHYETRDQMVPPETARKLIAEAAKRGSVVSYEDIYGAVDEPVVVARFVMTKTARETNERKKRHAED